MNLFKKKDKINSEIKFTIQSESLTISFNEFGQIVKLDQHIGTILIPINAFTVLNGFSISSIKIIQKEIDIIVFHKCFINKNGIICYVKEKIIAKMESIGWEFEIQSDCNEFFSTEIITEFNHLYKNSLYWTAWSDPEQKNSGWRDPLVLMPLQNTKLEYSNISNYTPEKGNYISIPMLTIVDKDSDLGISLAVSPNDTIINMHLLTNKNGECQFIRNGNRLGKNRIVKFSMDIVLHEADWRGGLRFYTEKFSDFFNPPNKNSYELAGCGAYSGYEGTLNVTKLDKMGFKVNWKLSDDFPYMGMFIPPIKNENEEWIRSSDEPRPLNKADNISAKQMNDYAIRMKENGFYVLNYFNVTEFGKDMKSKKWKKDISHEDSWENPVRYSNEKMPDAFLEKRLITFYGAFITDCGNKEYQDFLIEQIERHIQYLPDTSGICIDRLDWLRHFNLNADDNETLINHQGSDWLVIY